MGSIVQATIAGMSAFIATNIDDLVISMIFFGQVNSTFRPQQIVLGKYLGFAVLVLLSLPGFFGGLFIAREWIGLLGILPIAIGFKQGLSPDREANEVQAVSDKIVNSTQKPSRASRSIVFLAPQTYSIAAITIANGGDNIGIYVPLFASSNWATLSIILLVFMVFVAIWCIVAYRLVQFPAIAHILSRYGQTLVPVFLIGLGLFILIESKSYQLLRLLPFS
ncbi:cadmium resistance transporter [Kamptonema cortianum]|uniref:Cadmium resistance transporter n=1 Tax=Geitlerinema calcuttense NRMC-F 0142 TaxID=2922238 RepID=A0ABT7LYD2_9CYAN|nr:cadmium resistance transporter [Geitlerinema calcuttense]MDI9638370.1 cadmium resistance transporter [Geitlerinema splendidum]MDK3155787.1 cadmium resistance transporter [Kamptonema cortianum]MDL5045645.1 cadmium resistance transporter [Oscillatoria amoena NRMC-F 0135]MDL5056120.1 cadmium resistance transporter [Geitlerinema calcuttense NRMC-F 0142]